MGILMHKLTKAFYGMLKHNKPFDMEVDQANINQAEEQQTEESQIIEQQQIIKELELMEQAPCSHRATQKMKTQLTPQTSNLEVNTRSSIKPEQT